VVDAIHDDRLYILTNVETETRLRGRLERVLNDAAAATA
jgi:hypothetical protein